MISDEFITASIVLYKQDVLDLKKTIDCFLKTPLNKKLFLIDNSPTDVLRQVAKHPEVEYNFVGRNIGFGTGHNTVIDKIKEVSKYHLILNPDVIFASNVIPELIEQIEKCNEVALIAPKVLFPDGQHQYSCRKYPGLLELLARKVSFLNCFFKTTIAAANYQNKDLNRPLEVDYLTGCFLLFKTSDFITIKGFDERYFIYMEDVDICRKLEGINKKKVYFPHLAIYHTLERGSSKKIKLLLHHILSVFQYFYKWGLTTKKAIQKNG